MSRPISFQEKFKDRIGLIGKEGVIGLVKQTENQIQNNQQLGEVSKLNEWSEIYNKNQKNVNNLVKNGNMVINNTKPLSNNQPNLNGPTNNINMNYVNPIPEMIHNQPNFPPPFMNPYHVYPMNPLPGYMYSGIAPQIYGNPLIQPYYNQYSPQNYYNNPPVNYNNQKQHYLNKIPFPNQINYPQPSQNLEKVLNNNNINNESMKNNPDPLNILQMNNRQRLKQKNETNTSKIIDNYHQRSFSSKSKYDKNNPSTSNNKSNSKDKIFSIDKAQNTHPDSFSNKQKENNNKSINDNDVTYHPYTLKDYKELANGKIILGGLGPNTGTKEWEEKMKKMKKIADYSENVKKTKKVHLKPLKETHNDIIEREKKDKLEGSSRNKAAQYGKNIKKIKVNRYPSDIMFDNSNLNNDKINNNDELVHMENSKIDNENKMKNDLNEFNEIKKKRDYLTKQVNAFKDDILK